MFRPKNLSLEMDHSQYSDRRGIRLSRTQSCLSVVSNYDTDAELRRLAIDQLDEKDALATIALNDPDKKVRLAALTKLNEQNSIAEVLEKKSTRRAEIVAVAPAASRPSQTRPVAVASTVDSVHSLSNAWDNLLILDYPDFMLG